MHPDKQGGSTQAFQRVVAAEAALSDARLRAEYDAGADLIDPGALCARCASWASSRSHTHSRAGGAALHQHTANRVPRGCLSCVIQLVHLYCLIAPSFPQVSLTR
jgi:hypothetical protein